MVANKGLNHLLNKKYILDDIPFEYLNTRKTNYWTTLERVESPSRNILYKDISDVHLNHIISYLIRYPRQFSLPEFKLKTMKFEKKFRELNNISVPDYVNKR